MLLMRAYKKDNEVAVIDEDYSNNVTVMMVYITEKKKTGKLL